MDRLTRRDLWLCLLVVVTAIVLRGWRIEQPAYLYSDERYHVGTATEFLQAWRYDDVRTELYEYTHPHLAKYAMAVGIRTLGASRPMGWTDLGTHVAAVTLEQGSATSTNGPPLLWAATPEGLVGWTPGELAPASTVEISGVQTLYATADRSLWGTTVSGDLFRAAATKEGMLVLTEQWSLGIPDTAALCALANAALVATSNELLRVVDGEVVGRTSVLDGRDLTCVQGAEQNWAVVASGSGLTVVDPESMAVVASAPVAGGVHALAILEWSDWFPEPAVYAAHAQGIDVYALTSTGGLSAVTTINIPNATALTFDSVTHLLYAVEQPSRHTASAATVWTIAPWMNTYFDSTEIPPVDGGDAGALLVAGALVTHESAGGAQSLLRVVSTKGQTFDLSVGHTAAGWRWPGVIAGAIAAMFLVLLARLLTKRRDVAAWTGGLVLIDGLAFTQSRIGMNDVYLLAFLLAATCTFIAWLQGRTGRVGGAGLLIITGVLLGCALASKWTALYGIGGLGLLWLGRSHLGRMTAVVLLAAIGAILCAMSISTAAAVGSPPNVPLLAAVTVIVALAALAARRGAPPGSVWRVASFGPTLLWLGEGLKVAGALIAVPLVVYVVSYLPWVELGNQLVSGWPAGSTGQTLTELTAAMYQYHDGLRVIHPSGSPWWSWPFELKPFLFLNGSSTVESGSMTTIVGGGSLVLRVVSGAALVWLVMRSWRNRSYELAAVGIIFLALWMPWARVDRVAFLYHYYPSSQIALIAIALLIADVLRGSTRATTILKAGLAALLLYVPLLWSLSPALCWLAGAAGSDEFSLRNAVCGPDKGLPPETIIGAGALLAGLWLVRQLAPLLGARRTVLVFSITAMGWSLLCYPLWSAMPLPEWTSRLFLLLSPTWANDFVFIPITTQLASTPPLSISALIGLVLLLGLAAAVYRGRHSVPTEE